MRVIRQPFFFLITTVLFYSCVSPNVKKTKDHSFIFKSVRAEKDYVSAYNQTLRLWDVAYEEKDINTTLGSAHVIMAGNENAPPLVLLHGLNASSTMWYPNVETFARDYRVYAIDFIMEPGKSIPNRVNASKDDIINWYREVFDKLKLKKLSIVGASRGGWLALQLAIAEPDRVEKIVLLSPAQALTSIKVRKKVMDNIMFAMFPKRVKLRDVLTTLTQHVDQLRQSYINQFYIASKNARINKSLFQMTPFSDDELKNVNIPVMILIGDHDIINSTKGLERAKELMPQAETDVIENCGHFLSFDKSEVINKRVLKFLKDNNS